MRSKLTHKLRFLIMNCTPISVVSLIFVKRNGKNTMVIALQVASIDRLSALYQAPCLLK